MNRLSNAVAFDKLTRSKCFVDTVSVQDKTKVAKARGGTNPTTPASLIGQVAAELGLRAHEDEQTDPPPPPPPPPPPGTLAAVWQLDAAFTEGGASNFAGPPRDHAYQLGWRAVYIQLLHTTYAAANELEIPVFVKHGWIPVGWGTYGQDSNAYQDGLAAAEICTRLPALKGWKANGELWAESENAWKTGEFLRGWREAGAPVPLGWSVLSSDTANFARSYDYPTALSVEGADIDIQVYGATYPTYTVGAGNGMLDKAAVPTGRRAMSFDVDNQGEGPFADYRTWTGPRRLWNATKATVSTFDQLVR